MACCCFRASLCELSAAPRTRTIKCRCSRGSQYGRWKLPSHLRASRIEHSCDAECRCCGLLFKHGTRPSKSRSSMSPTPTPPQPQDPSQRMLSPLRTHLAFRNSVWSATKPWYTGRWVCNWDSILHDPRILNSCSQHV